jgi:FkbM family methyltransferase
MKDARSLQNLLSLWPLVTFIEWLAIVAYVSALWARRTISFKTAGVFGTVNYVRNSGGRCEKYEAGVTVYYPRSGLYEVKMHLRSKTSDFQVFYQIWKEHEYDTILALLRREYRERVLNIVDIGANIGCATVLFAREFPEAKVIAVEPDESNFASLVANIHLNKLEGAVKAINAALWTEEATLGAVRKFRDGAEWAIQFEESTNLNVAQTSAITFEKLIKLVGNVRIDLLKIDIEGAESRWFNDPRLLDGLLGQVNALAIEIHPESISIEESVAAISKRGFLCVIVQETVFGIRKSMIRH